MEIFYVLLFLASFHDLQPLSSRLVRSSSSSSSSPARSQVFSHFCFNLSTVIFFFSEKFLIDLKLFVAQTNH